MVFEKERIIKELKDGRIAISRLSRLLKIPYYKLKFEIVPEMEKGKIVTTSKEDRYVYVELINNGRRNN